MELCLSCINQSNSNVKSLRFGDKYIMQWTGSDIFVNIGPGFGFFPVWCHAISWTSIDLLSIAPKLMG